MPELILDTSSKYAVIALRKNNKLIDSLIYEHESLLSKKFSLSLQQFLDQHFLKVSHLKKIILGTGPGSYASTRTAVSIALGFSVSQKITIYPFCSLLLFLPDPTPLETWISYQNCIFRINRDQLLQVVKKHASSAPSLTELTSYPHLNHLEIILTNPLPAPPQEIKIIYSHTPI